MIGKIISHYKISEELGRGGMGVVYKAEDTKLKRTVALKFLPPELTRDPEAKERFIQEAQAASGLQHNNICTIHDIDETAEGQLFIVMDYYQGETLKSKIGLSDSASRTGSWPVKTTLPDRQLAVGKVIDITLQIGEGLKKAHQNGIIHRDIKPANILITNEGTVKILDFGLAKLAGHTSRTKVETTLGTVAYMSPEQAQGKEIDQRTDIWSLGVVLYEMMTGKKPFQSEYEQALIYAILNEEPPVVSSLRPDILPLLAETIQRAMQKDRDKRFQSIEEMMAALSEIQQNPIEHQQEKTRGHNRIAIFAISIFLLVVISLYLFYSRSGSPPSTIQKSIAVLPFKNLSDSKEDEYFSDGITDDIIAQLSKISELKVISRTSVMQYKGTNKNIRQIGQELDVGTVLEGSVRHAGNQVRIVAQLIDARNEGHLWADTYDKELTQIFAVQSEVAQQIAFVLKARFSPVERKRIEKVQTENTEAYQFYLKGRFYWNKRTAADLQKAIDYFKKAINKDPDYAQAYAGLASSYVLIPEYDFYSMEAIQKAKTAAKKSLELDPNAAEAHTVIGMIKFKYEWDWAGAETEFRYAIELDPSYPSAHQWYYIYLISMKRKEEALAEIKRAHELDPLSLVINVNYGDAYFFIRQYDRAIEQFQKTIELDSEFPPIYASLGQSYQEQGKLDKAMSAFQKYKTLGGSESDVKTLLGYIYALTGKKSEAHQMLSDLIKLHEQGNRVTYNIAWLYIGLGDKDKTFEWLEKAYQEHDLLLFLLNIDPYWDSIRSDPRFISLLKKMGLEK